MQKKHVFVLILLISLFWACSGSHVEPQAAARTDGEPNTVLDVEFAPAREVRREREIITTGSLSAVETVTVSSEVEGRIEKINYDIGDFVRRGSILLELDKRELQLQRERASASLEEALARVGASHPSQLPRVEELSEVRQAQALLEDAERKLQRADELLKKGVISQAQVDETRTNRDVAASRRQNALENGRNRLASIKNLQAALALAEKDLSDTQVRSPLSGYVDKRLVSEGEYVRENAPVFTLVQSQTLKLLVEVPEREATAVRRGGNIRVEVDAFPNREFQARIQRISPTVDQKSRTFQIEARVENPNNLLKPGFFARCRILAGERPMVLVPNQALFMLAGVKKVFVKHGDQVKERLVETGLEEEGAIEIRSGVKAGEEVAVTQLADLSDGQRVK